MIRTDEDNWEHIVGGVFVAGLGAVWLFAEGLTKGSIAIGAPVAGFGVFAFLDGFNNDDFVGELIPTCLLETSYGDANYEIRDEDGSYAGRANLLNTTVSPVPSPCEQGGGGGGPAVNIAGPGEITPGEQCTWVASVAGLTPPLSYTWFVNGEPILQGSDTYVGTSLEPAFQLQLVVGQAGGGGGVDTRTVVTDPRAPPCLE
ncbi:MAG TPA: hypothetical protein VGA37_14825 [Gemmatimonadales bacterium]